MLKSLLTTTAAAALLIGSAQAQETQTEDPVVVEPQAEQPLEAATDTAEDAAAETGDAMESAAGDAAEGATDAAQEATGIGGSTAEDATAMEEQPVDAETTAADETEGDSMESADAPAGADFGAPQEGWTKVDPGTVSAETVIGADITNLENEQVATVGDVLMTPDGKVENIVAEFGGFLGFGKNTVLLSLDEVDFVQSEDEQMVLRTDLTPEELEGRPEYEPEAGTEVEG